MFKYAAFKGEIPNPPGTGRHSKRTHRITQWLETQQATLFGLFSTALVLVNLRPVGIGQAHLGEAGVTYLATDDVQLDLNGGWDLNSEDYFLGFGIAVRRQ